MVAEGVETLEILDVLRESGCHTVQRFLINKPVPLGSFIQLMETQTQKYTTLLKFVAS